ncbi:MAG: hypothetical protein JW807_07890 [Spirochaetes bacterium]|nr:hypothetical protein [Spirochaetota bacterium]
MADQLEAAAGSLADYTKKLEIATFYANGNEDRAKQIVAGTLKDVYAIKGRFSSTSSFGAFIAFFNNQYLTLNSVYPVISDSFALKEMKTNVEWVAYEQAMLEFHGGNQHDDVMERQFKNTFTSSFTLTFSGELKKMVEEGNEIDTNRRFQQMIQDRMGYQGVNMVVDVEKITSLDMELYSLTSRKMEEYRAHQEQTKDLELDIQVEPDQNDMDALQGREVKLIVRGSLILSPISGRDIGLLVAGDRLKIKVLDNHPKAVHLLKVLNAYQDEQVQPIIGRIVSMRHRADGGYTIFAAVAKGIFVKIEELEEGIKVAIDTSYMSAPAENVRASRTMIGVMAGLGALLLVLVALILYFLLK